MSKLSELFLFIFLAKFTFYLMETKYLYLERKYTMNNDWIYRNNEEWRKQRAKVKELEKRIALYDELLPTLGDDHQEYLHILRARSGCKLGLGPAKEKLETIEKTIRATYALSSLPRDSFEIADDDDYLTSIIREGFIGGFKF